VNQVGVQQDVSACAEQSGGSRDHRFKLKSRAKARKYEETVAALAELSQSTVEIVRPLMQGLRDDGVLIPGKAAGLSWETVDAVLKSRFTTGSMGLTELTKAKAQYAGITTENAHRLLRFWQVRSSSSSSIAN